MTEDFSDPDDPFTPVGTGVLSLGDGTPPPSAGVPGSGLGAAASLRPVAGGAYVVTMRERCGWKVRLTLCV